MDPTRNGIEVFKQFSIVGCDLFCLCCRFLQMNFQQFLLTVLVFSQLNC